MLKNQITLSSGINEIKQWTEEEVSSYMQAMPIQLETPYPLYEHQKRAFIVLTQRKRLGLFLDMGLGKTKIVLDSIWWFKKAGELKKKVLVVLPNTILLHTWWEEAKKRPGVKVWVQNYDEKSEIKTADVVVVNRQRLLSWTKGKTDEKKQVWKMEVIGWFQKHFDMLVVDESYCVKNPTTQIFNLLKLISANYSFACLMTGTPVGKDLIDIWTQAYLIDRGETFGSDFYKFRQKFCKKHERIIYGRRIINYTIKQGASPFIYKGLSNILITYRTDECIKLPTMIKNSLRVPSLNSDELAMYNQNYDLLIKQAKESRLINNKERDVVAQNSIEATFIKLRQIMSGFVYQQFIDDETGEKVERSAIDITQNPTRLDALRNLMDVIPYDKKCVIFHEFIYSGQVISKLLSLLGISHYALNATNKKEALEAFTDGDCRVLVMNSVTGSLGLNLQAANYMVFYECPVSAPVRLQAEKRCHRLGQEDTVFIYDIFIENTLDERILFYLNKGKSLINEIMNGNVEL